MMQGARANILDAVGGTPLVRLQRVVPADLHAELYAKCEFLNPAGSVKDRAALHLVLQAEGAGRLRPGGTLVAATHGSAGASLAMVAAVRGYRCVFVVPDKVSAGEARRAARLGRQGGGVPRRGRARRPAQLTTPSRAASPTRRPTRGSCDQHHNPGNPEAHALHTGPELWTQTGGELDAVVAPLDTGGTLSGIGRFLKEKQPAVRVVGVDAVGSVYFDHLQRAEDLASVSATSLRASAGSLCPTRCTAR
jgi:cystathionine beta-synthase